MQKKRNNVNGMQNVYITVSNALDQSDKHRIEVAKDLTVEQAIRQEGLAPAGAFDVFDASGRVISNEKVARLAEENVYVGVQKVAGGADWNAGWGGGEVIVVEPAADVDLENELPSKGLCFVSSFNDNSRNTVIPGEGETVQTAAKASGLIPRDGSAWDVYDGMGRVVTDKPSANYIGQTLWINASAIGGGSGLPINRLGELRTDYPSLRTIRGRQTNREATMFAIRLPDGKHRTKNGYYECVVDANSMVTYVLNTLTCDHPHAYSQTTIPGTKRQSFGVCQGNIGQIIGVSADPIEIMGSYLNHIISVLNS
jgi:hypothetical protein